MTDFNALFEYRDGDLYWKVKPNKRLEAGHKVAANVKALYKQVAVDGKKFYVHRVIWMMHNGPIPAGMQIDHFDENKHNNAISNLRLATNGQNQAAKSSNAKSFKGVYPRGSRFVVKVGRKHIGTYDTPTQAQLAYNQAASQMLGVFVHLNEVSA